MNSLRKIILYTNASSDVGYKKTRQVGEIMQKNGFETVLCPAYISENTNAEPPSGYTFFELKAELATAEMIITFGGDGTILRAARAAADIGVPILGINMGGKGFIAELEADDIELLKTVATDDYTIESRMMLDVEAQRDGVVIYRDFALNDVVVKGDNKVIDMAIYGDRQRITQFSGDGAVIATPTGSTAYSMSAGGPLVEPTAKNIIITPICAHVLEAKSFVLVAGRVVTIDLSHKKSTPAYVSIDGGDHISIQRGDIIKVNKSERFTQLVRLSNRSFYHKISSKLVSS
jgi:NAD+ kinase